MSHPATRPVLEVQTDNPSRWEGDLSQDLAITPEDLQRFDFAALETAAIFAANRGLPPAPTATDLGALKDLVGVTLSQPLRVGKSLGLRVNENEIHASKNNHFAAAVTEVCNELEFGLRCNTPEPKVAPQQALPAIPEGVGLAVSTKALPSSDGSNVGQALRTSATDTLSHLVFHRKGRGGMEYPHQRWKLKRVICGHHGWVRCLDVDVGNEWFVSGANDRLIKVWDLATGELKLSLTGHVHSIRGLIISPRHPYLFSCGEDNTVKCWDLEVNKVIRHYHGHLSGVYSMTLHPTLDVLATGGRDSTVRLWDIRTRECVHVLSGHKSTVWSLASQGIEPQLISGSADHTIRCWDLRSAKSSVILTHHSKTIRSLSIHPRLYAYLSTAGGELKMWRGADSAYERDFDPCGSIINCSTIKDDPDSAVVVAGTDSGELHFWDWSSGKRFQTIESIPQPGSLASENAIFACKFDRSETRLITAECDKTIKIWVQDENYVPAIDER